MILHTDSNDITEQRTVVLPRGRAARGVGILNSLKDELARAVFLEELEVNTVIRLIGRRE